MNRRRVLTLERGAFPARSGEVEICLVYPNRYEVGMSNLGFQLVYKALNQLKGVVCERAFLDTGQATSLETGRRLSRFPLLAFTLSYELDFLNVLHVLRSARIPPHSEERPGLPILLLGGAAAFANPLPYSRFFDLICIGEGEVVLHDLIDLFRKNPQKVPFLQTAQREMPGIWAPQHGKTTVRRVWVKDLNSVDTSAACVSPLAHFRNMHLVQVERGCPFSCRFCLASPAYSPYRPKAPEKIYESIVRSDIEADSVGLVGTAVSEVPGLVDLVRRISARTQTVGISSLRLDRVDDGLIRVLIESGLRTITIAPEAGSEKLRYIINKRIRDERILELADMASSLRVPRLKLYFMVGLPFERDEDLGSLVSLVRKFRKIYRGELVVSVNPFVPKPHTPFQYHGMEEKKSLARKTSFLARKLTQGGRLKLITKSAREATLQGIVSLGDEAVGDVLLRMVDERVGWEMALRSLGVGPESYLAPRALDSVLPWGFIDFGINQERLAESYSEARRLSQE